MKAKVLIGETKSICSSTNRWYKVCAIRGNSRFYRRVNHPNIIFVLSVVDNLNEGEIWIVTELLDGGSLVEYCFKDKRDVLNVHEKIRIGVQCWSALSYLHDIARITHHDIKPANILVTDFSNFSSLLQPC